MDIVERAAALLGSSSGSQRKLDSHHAVQGARTADWLERAAAEVDASRAPEARLDQEKRSEKKPTACIARARSRSLSVDLGTLRAQRIITPSEKTTMMTESFRRVKRHILANVSNPASGPRRNLVMITSSLPGEGKTFCSVNLAISLAMEVDRTVMLVDADVENPCVPAALGIKEYMPRGFIDMIADPSLDVADVLYKTDLGKLTLLPAGSPHAHTTELLAGDATAQLLQQMAARYEDRIIIFDSAPLLVASESCALATHMGQIVLVVEAGRTTENTLKEALSRIESCNVAGVLLNKGPASTGARQYGYGYGAAV